MLRPVFCARSGLVALLLGVSGCGSQTSPAYHGESLLTLAGSVELQEGAGADPLVPTLAFEGPYGRWRVIEADVEGEFPASFTLRVFAPPPDEAMYDLSSLGLDEPRFATAYITAAHLEHETSFTNANNLTLYHDCPAFDACTRIRRDACAVDEARAETHDGFDPSYCYAEIRECAEQVDVEMPDASWDDCWVVERLGDPALAKRPAERFAGFVQHHRVIYLEEDLPPRSFTGRMLGIRQGLAGGYHVLEEHLLSAQEQAEATECLDAAEELGLEHYLEDHPDVDCTFVPAMEDESASIECVDREARAPITPDIIRAQAELDCPSVGDRVFVPVDPASEPIHLEVGDDVPDFGFGDP